MLSEAVTKKASMCKRTNLPYNGAVLSSIVVGNERFCAMFRKYKDTKSWPSFS